MRYNVAKNTLDEQDAECTLGYDLDNADTNNDLWTGWETNVAYDIWDSAQNALGQDGLTNDTGDVSWWGHCNMATAVIICENEPTGDYTTNGVVFTPEIKKGLLVALYHNFEYLYDSGTNVLPHIWQQKLEERLIGSNTMVG